MKNSLLVFFREVRDQIRDRRTLFMVAVLPVLLYPALGIGMLEMTLVFSEQPRTVVILGADDLPEPPLVEDGRFREQYFALASDASKLNVITDTDPEPGEAAASRLDAARQIEALLAKRDAELLKAAETREDESDAVANGHESAADELSEQVGLLMSVNDIQVLLIVPEDLDESITEFNRKLADGEDVNTIAQPRPRVVRNSAEEKSLVAANRVDEALRLWEREILQQRLSEANLPQELVEPISIQTIDTALPESIAASVWSKVFPALLVIMAVTGAFYPAVDVCAGEKERGTMETVLICPAQRHEIVTGKFLTILLFSVTTALLNLGSMALTGQYMMGASAKGAIAAAGGLDFPPPEALAWVVVILVPLAALFSALSLALAMFAKSSKEGQYYLTPLLTVVLGLTVFCISPGVEIDPLKSLMPVVGPTLLLKAMLVNPGGASELLYVVPVIVSSIGYSLLALYWAVEQFRSEEILFREAEQFDLGLWLKSLVVERERTPTFGEAIACFVTMLFLQFATMNLLQSFMPEPPADMTNAERVERFNSTVAILVVIQQVALIALPPLLFGMLLTRSMRDTFRLRFPSLKYLVAGIVLPFVFHAPAVGLVEMLAPIFPPIPEEFARVFENMSDESIPTWKVLIGIALLPAICEEIAFRGFLLSGFSNRGRLWIGILFSSICFGFIHLIPIQVFYATVLGAVLGLLAVRSRSLLPPILFHLINNSLSALQKRVSVDVSDPTGGALFEISRADGAAFATFEYGWMWTAGTSVVAIAATVWLIRTKTEVPLERRSAPHDPSSERVSIEGDQETELADRAVAEASAT